MGEWTKTAPKEAGWYWHTQGGGMRMLHVFPRPGHTYLCIEDEPAGMRRNFLAVEKLGGFWSEKPVMPPASPLPAND